VASVLDLLVKVQLIDERQWDAVMSRSSSRSGGHVVQQVAEMGYATEGTVARAISVELGLPRIDLSMTPAEPAAVALLDARICADRFVLPVALRENGELLWLAMADPTDLEAIGVVKRRTQKRVRPAVAGPTEILKAVRTLYAAPDAGTGRAEKVDSAKLAAIEIANEDAGDGEAEAPFEVVNVGEDIGGAGSGDGRSPKGGASEEGSPISRIAKQLGVEVPAHMPSQREAPGGKRAKRPESIEVAPPTDTPAPPIDSSTKKAITAIPPKTDPRIRQKQGAPRAPATSAPPPISKNITFEELLTPVTTPGPIGDDDLGEEDASTLDALRASMEKGAMVLRSLAELCLEKGVFTREEMKRRNAKPGAAGG